MIDRTALVARHDPALSRSPAARPARGGQRRVRRLGRRYRPADLPRRVQLPPRAARATLLGTQAQWAWHTSPAPEGQRRPSRAPSTTASATGSSPTSISRAAPGGEATDPTDAWRRENPHRLHLGLMGLRLDGAAPAIGDLEELDQHLDMAAGVITSRFTWRGTRFAVTTCVHPDRETPSPCASRASGLGPARAGLSLHLPYGSGDWSDPADFGRDDAHTTELVDGTAGQRVRRRLDADGYDIVVHGAALQRDAPHRLHVDAEHDSALELVLEFVRADEPVAAGLGVDALLNAARRPLASVLDRGRRRRDRGRPRGLRGRRGASSSAARCSRSSSRRSIARAPPRRPRRAWSRTPGAASSTSRCTGGTRRTSRSGAAAAARAQPRLVRAHPASGAGDRPHAGLRGRALAEAGGAGGGRDAEQHRPVPALAATASRSTSPSSSAAPTRRRSTATRSSSTSRPRSWRPSPSSARAPSTSTARSSPRRSRTADARDQQRPRVRARLLAVGAADRGALARAAGVEAPGAWRGSPRAWRYRPWRTGATWASASSRRSSATTTRATSPRSGSSPTRASSTAASWARRSTTCSADWHWPSTWGWDYPVMAMTATRLGRPGMAVASLLLGCAEEPLPPNGHNAQTALPAALPAGQRRAARRGRPHGGGLGDSVATTPPGFPAQWGARAEGVLPMP